jgi:hypothetical protein
MLIINNEELMAAMKDLGIDKLPIRKIQIDQNEMLSNPFTTCMSVVEEAIGEVLAAHASWRSQMAASAALLEIENSIGQNGIEV